MSSSPVEQSISSVLYLYSLLDALSFFDILTLCQVERQSYNICISDQYWQYRANKDGALVAYFQSGSLIKPKIKYAWAMILTLRTSADHRYFIYLSDQTDLLFIGLELLLGLDNFLIRAVKLNDLPMVKYAMSLGPSYMTMITVIRIAVDLDRQQIARYISETTNDWYHYNARYRPDLMYVREGDNALILAQYGHFHLLKHLPPSTLYRLSFLLFHRQTSEFIEELNMSDILNDEETRLIASIIWYGDVEILDAYLRKVGGEDVREYLKRDRYVVSAVIQIGTYLDRVDMVDYVLQMMPDNLSLSHVTVRSLDMFNVLAEHFDHMTERAGLDSIPSMLRGILYGNNYRLFFDHLMEGVFTSQRLRLKSTTEFFDRIAPFMIEFLAKDPDLFEAMKERLTGVRARIDGFTYNFMRSIGFPKTDIRVYVPKNADMSKLPYLSEVENLDAY